MNKRVWHINVDMGEGLQNEASLMSYISACNIACGGHAGDKATMKNVIQLARKHQVAIGAHPSFPDRKHFGRKVMKITPKALFESLTEQLTTLDNIVKEAKGSVQHVKPHGALYNLAAKDKSIARIVLKAIQLVTPKVQVYAPYHSVMAKIAKAEGFEVLQEAFADRSYHNDYSLVSRSHAKAILLKPESVFQQLQQMATQETVTTIEGNVIAIIANTFCIHGDHPHAEKVLQYISEQSKMLGVQIKNN